MNVPSNSTAAEPRAMWSRLDEVMIALCDGADLAQAVSMMVMTLPKSQQDAFLAVSGKADQSLAEARDLLTVVMESLKSGEKA